MASREEMLEEGYKYACLACRTCYKKLPTENYEDGHSSRLLAMCRCGCDLFAHLKDGSKVYPQ